MLLYFEFSVTFVGKLLPSRQGKARSLRFLARRFEPGRLNRSFRSGKRPFNSGAFYGSSQLLHCCHLTPINRVIGLFFLEGDPVYQKRSAFSLFLDHDPFEKLLHC